MHDTKWINFGIEDEDYEELADVTVALSKDERKIVLKIDDRMLFMSKHDARLLSSSLESFLDDVIED